MLKMSRALVVTAALLMDLLSAASCAAADVEQLVLGDHVMTLQWLMNC